MYGGLAGLGLEDFTLDTYDIAHIVLLEIRIGLFTDAVSSHIYLDIAGQILYIQKDALPMTRLDITRPAMRTVLPSSSSKLFLISVL